MPRKSKAQLLEQFKEYAVLHPKLATVDMHLMRAIREPGVNIAKLSPGAR